MGAPSPTAWIFDQGVPEGHFPMTSGIWDRLRDRLGGPYRRIGVIPCEGYDTCGSCPSVWMGAASCPVCGKAINDNNYHSTPWGGGFVVNRYNVCDCGAVMLVGACNRMFAAIEPALPNEEDPI